MIGGASSPPASFVAVWPWMPWANDARRYRRDGEDRDGAVPCHQRWQELVGRKQEEIRDKMEELRRMKGILDLLEDCDCPDLDVCGAAAAAEVR